MTIYDNNKVMILIMVIIIMIVKRTRIKIEKIKTYGNILEQKKKAFMYTTMQRVKFNDNCS